MELPSVKNKKYQGEPNIAKIQVGISTNIHLYVQTPQPIYPLATTYKYIKKKISQTNINDND